MGSGIQVFLVVISLQILVIAAQTSQDYAALNALKANWENTPPSWVGADPCVDGWEGITCTDSRVTSITLASMNLTGQLSGDLQYITELKILDLSYNKGLTGSIPPTIGNLKSLSDLLLIGCSFSGVIPDTIGSLNQLVQLSLNSNQFTGPIPPSIGNLTKLYWLDLSDNKLTGTIPVSNGATPGLDMLVNTKHFHLGINQFSGELPSQLFSSNMTLIHVLFENNTLTGEIPSTLALVRTLEVIRLDRNSLNGSVPTDLSELSSLSELYLSNNKLTGAVPNLTGMNFLTYVDMSNNSFDVSDIPPWFSTIQSLTTLVMQGTGLRGQLPVSLFSLPELQTVTLSNNEINGTLDFGTYSNQLHLVDLSNNNISAFTQRAADTMELILVNNPICQATTGTLGTYCTITQPTNSYSTPENNCVAASCSSGQISSPNCKCAYPYTGNLSIRSPAFSNLQNSTIFDILHESLVESFQSNQLPVDSVSMSNPRKDSSDYLVLSLEIFPSGQDRFNRTGILEVAFVLSNHTFEPPPEFEPYFFIGDAYATFAEEPSSTKSSSNTGIIVGAVAGSCVLVLLLLLAGLYALRQKKRAERATKQNNPFASWDPDKGSGSIPQLKGAKCFSFEELRKCTNNFSDDNGIGSGGYGKVYRGTLTTGQMVAIKRAQQGSMQGGLEFKTEIELLSRVHHKNVVSLVGFCFDQREQMLVYEFIANGTLSDSLSGKSGIRLDWARRLRAALGAARGLQYLHVHADPPIIHRDIKSNNILLDERLNAKVADFGLSKLMGDAEKGYVTTQVKGTMGYLDPEYYMTNQLTEKSDVYSFGVLLLELITAKAPIEKGKYIVREVKQAMDKKQDLYNLHAILDPVIGVPSSLKGVERFVDLAMSCVHESGNARPTMSEVVKEIESIMELAGLNPNAESAATSASYEDSNKGFEHPYSNEGLFAYSGAFVPLRLEPQ